MQPSFILGRKAICEFMGGKTWDTLKKWAKEKGLPIENINTPIPGMSTEKVDEWLRIKLRKETGYDSREKTQNKIYFIQAEAGGLIKIGITHNLKVRFNNLKNSCPIPLKILATIDGSADKEIELHERFATHRKHGEWFEPCPEILQLIEQIKQNKK